MLFNAKIKNRKIDEGIIKGMLIWDDGDEQEFLWNIPNNEFNYKKVSELLNYLIQNKLTKNDKIIISKKTLVDRLKKEGWNLGRINNTIDCLCSVRIAMIDQNITPDERKILLRIAETITKKINKK